MKKIIHLTEEEHETMKKGMKLLQQIFFIVEYPTWEETQMHWLGCLFEYEQHLIQKLKEKLPFEGTEEDMLSHIDEMVEISEENWRMKNKNLIRFQH